MPRGVKESIPIALATFAIGITFGLLAAPLMGEWLAIAMSALVFAGGAQFAVLSVLSGGGSVLVAAAAGATTNVRFLPMGFAIVQSATGGPLARAGQAATMTDASFLIGRTPGKGFDTSAIAWAFPLQYVGWVGGTVIGALGAGVIGNPEDLGLDIILPVFFLGLLLPELRASRPRKGIRPRPLLAAALAATVTLALTPVLPAGLPILAGAAVALIGLVPPRSGGPATEEATA